MSKDKTLDKIAALLAKAESTDSEHERDALQQKAYELMSRYGIEQVELQNKRKRNKQKQEQVVEWTTILEGRPYMKQQMRLAHEIVSAQGTMRVLQQPLDAHHMRLYVFGYESDVAAFRMLFDSLRLQMMSSMQQWWKREGLDEHKHLPSYRQLVQRREFMFSYAEAVYHKLARARAAAEKQHDSETNMSSGSTALALRSRNEDAAAFMHSRYNVGRGRATRSLAGSASSSAAGSAAGARANVGGTSVRTGRAGALSA